MADRDEDEEQIITQGGTRRARRAGSSELVRAPTLALEDAHQRMDAIDANVLAHVRDVRTEIAEVRDDVVHVHTRVAHIEGQMVHLVRSYERTAEQAAREAEAELELRKAERMSAVNDRTQDREARRAVLKELGFKLIIVLMGAWALISALLNRKC